MKANQKSRITFSKVDDTSLDKFNKFLERAENVIRRYPSPFSCMRYNISSRWVVAGLKGGEHDSGDCTCSVNLFAKGCDVDGVEEHLHL